MSQLCSRVLAEVQTRIVAHLGALPRRSQPTLLDVGCWDGASTARYGEALGGARLLGVEVFEDQAREAERRGIEVARVDLERGSFPWAQQTVDVVVCNQVLEHLKNIWLPLSEMARVLRPAGHAILAVPNLASFHNRVLLALGIQPTSIRTFGPHVRGYTFREFRTLVSYGGALEIVRREGVGFPPLAPPWSGPLSGLLPELAHTAIVVARRVGTDVPWKTWLGEQALDGVQTHYEESAG